MKLILTIMMMVLFISVKPEIKVEQIIDNNIANRGGINNFHKNKTITFDGQLTGPNLTATVKVYEKQPNLYREEVIIQDKTIIRAFDGEKGWTVNPFSGNSNAVLMEEQDFKNVRDQANIGGPLVDYKLNGNSIELLGSENIKGTDCYKLKITFKSGNKMFQYIDKKSFLEIREELFRPVNGKESVIEEVVGDYKKEGDVLFPHEFISNQVGSEDKYKLTIDKMVFNQNIDDSVFKFQGKSKE